MEDACSQCFSGLDDVIVLSSDETQDEEERLIKVRSKVGRKVRRRLLQNEEITGCRFWSRPVLLIEMGVQVVRIVIMVAFRAVALVI